MKNLKFWVGLALAALAVIAVLVLLFGPFIALVMCFLIENIWPVPGKRCW